METNMSFTRKTLGIKPHMNYAIVVVAKNPIKFSYMTAEDRVYGPGEIVPHMGPTYFFKLETAEAARERMQGIGLLREGVNGRYIVANPEDFEVFILGIDQYLTFREMKANKA